MDNLVKIVKMGSILTEKIPWLMNSPDTITLKTTNKYIYIK